LNSILGRHEKSAEPEVIPATLIPNGMRACTITATISSAVAGLLVPGNRVDVLCTTTNDLIKARTGGSSTKTLLENVGILAVDQRTTESKLDNNLRTVTLLVTPDDAAKVALAQTSGTLHLTLRSPKDSKSSNPKLATFNDLNGSRDGDQSETSDVAATTIRTLRGTTEGEATIYQRTNDAPPKRP
jgi:pilus assembly protein CpaB